MSAIFKIGRRNTLYFGPPISVEEIAFSLACYLGLLHQCLLDFNGNGWAKLALAIQEMINNQFIRKVTDHDLFFLSGAMRPSKETCRIGRQGYVGRSLSCVQVRPVRGYQVCLTTHR